MSTPGLGVQSSTVPIVIFPICKIHSPTLTGDGLRAGDTCGASKIAPAAVTVTAEPGGMPWRWRMRTATPAARAGRACSGGTASRVSNAHAILAGGS